MKCPHCGHDLDEDSRFCPRCAAPLPSPKDDRTPGNNRPAENGQPPENNRQTESDPQTGNRIPIPDPYAGYAVHAPHRAGNTEPAPGRGKGVVKAVLAVILYIALFFGIQSCVIGIYIGSNLDMTGAVLAAESGDQAAFESIFGDMMQSALDLVYKNQTRLLLIANLTSILVLCLQFRLRKKKPAEEFAFYPVSPLRLIQFALFGVALNGAISILLGLLPLPEGLYAVQENQYAALYEGSLLMNLLSVGIAGPVAEELFFRGIPMTRLEPVVGSIGAAVISSLLFGLAHGTPIAIGYAFAVGMVLALIYRKYRTVLPGIVCHCFFNMSSYWIRESWEGAAVVILGVVSVLILISTWYTAVVRYPAFTDLVWDTADRIRVDDPARAAVIEECRAARREGRLDMDTVERLSGEWDKACGKSDPGDGGGEEK